jgi:hypothetical protein
MESTLIQENELHQLSKDKKHVAFLRFVGVYMFVEGVRGAFNFFSILPLVIIGVVPFWSSFILNISLFQVALFPCMIWSGIMTYRLKRSGYIVGAVTYVVLGVLQFLYFWRWKMAITYLLIISTGFNMFLNLVIAIVLFMNWKRVIAS